VKVLSLTENCPGPLMFRLMDLLLVKFVAVTKTAPLLMDDPLAKVMIFPLLGRPAWGATYTSNGQPLGPDGMTKGSAGVMVKMGALATAGNANINSKAANLHTPPLTCFINSPFKLGFDFRRSGAEAISHASHLQVQNKASEY